MLVNIGPILIAVFAGLLLEGVPAVAAGGHRRRVRGVVLIGVATRSAETELVGVVLCVVAAVTYAAGVVAQKPLLRRLPGLQVTFTACAMGAICCLPWSGTLATSWAGPAGSIAGVVYLGAVPTALAFSTWAYALGRMDAGKLGVTTYVVPPLVILLGWLLLDEVPPPSRWSAGPSAWPAWGSPAAAPGSGRRCRSRRRPAPPSECGPAADGVGMGRPVDGAARAAGRFAWRSRTGRRWWPRPRGRRRSTTRSRGGSSRRRTGSTCTWTPSGRCRCSTRPAASRSSAAAVRSSSPSSRWPPPDTPPRWIC